jgi:hypothetical protein
MTQKLIGARYENCYAKEKKLAEGGFTKGSESTSFISFGNCIFILHKLVTPSLVSCDCFFLSSKAADRDLK